MHFEGEFRVPGRPEDVIHRFADVQRMASCMPGAALDTQDEDGAWHGGLLVTFGPKKIKFKGKVLVFTDLAAYTGTVNGRGAADMRAARVEVKLKYSLHAAPNATPPETVVALVSDAELTGVLADFARTGGQAFAKVLMEEFSRRAQAEFSKDLAAIPVPEQTATRGPDQPAASPPAMPAQRPPEPTAISATGLLWAVLKDKMAGWFRFLGFGRPR
ncbi:MAG: hypothetical protein EXR05_07145 [Acetobacteraceae bacterium]|nr:hypothetical protein [Acetobacteraceae bacterium]MSP30636.1 hypothetical protein [Acetobacteraceae bacterium]